MAPSEKENKAENILVAVRCRPMNQREKQAQSSSCFQIEHGNAVLVNPEHEDDRSSFLYDFVYGVDSLQSTVYSDIGEPLLDRAFAGYNGTIFTYGQTGSGKTFSMTGVSGDPDLEGLIPRMNTSIFDRIEKEKQGNPNKLFLVECSFFEIYNEIIYDLLDPNSKSNKKSKGLEIKEHPALGIYVKGLQERVVESHDEVLQLMSQGQQCRTVGATHMNAESSRSHSIFVIKIHQKDSTDESKNVFAKINLVDLAGSERANSTGAVGSRLKEGANINKSLSALGNVINALVEVARTGKKQFIPYRNSKLTRVLQESLGGNSLCSMLATLSPANINYIETLSTLKYAQRAKSIKVNAKKNEESSQISQLNDEIALLKQKLQEQTGSTIDSSEKAAIVEKYEKQIKEMDAIRMQTWEDKVKLSKKHEHERKRLAKEKALAQKKIEEEKQKRYLMLKDKQDVELVIQACCDLDVGLSSWLEISSAIKKAQNEAKEHRTLINVFKTAFDKDIASWKGLDSSSDANSDQMVLAQSAAKLRNIKVECDLMMELEAKVVANIRELVNATQSRLNELELEIANAKGVEALSRQQKLQYDEQQKMLSLAYQLAKKQKQESLDQMSNERKRILDLGAVVNKLVQELTSCVEQNCLSEEQADIAKGLVPSLQASWDKCQQSTDFTFHTPRYQASNDIKPIGVESADLIHNCRFSASTNPATSHLARLHGPSAWTAEEGDENPYLQLELDQFYHLHHVIVQGTPNSQLDGPFALTSENAKSALEQYPTSSLTGAPEQTYAILAWAFSWQELLKTTKIPTKLLSRPPVRFVHDVLSKIMSSTNFGTSAISTEEADYANLSTKDQRIAYLTKLIDLVKASNPTGECQVEAANIVAGMEVVETLKFLSLFALSALAHYLATSSPVKASESSGSWVSEMIVDVSSDGKDWSTSGQVSACTDPTSVVTIKFDSTLTQQTSKFVRLRPVEWENAAAIRFELEGELLIEQDSWYEELQQQAQMYSTMFVHLLDGIGIVLHQAQIQWQQIQESHKLSQIQYEQMQSQLEALKQTHAQLEKQLQQSEDQVQIAKRERDQVDSEMQLAKNKQQQAQKKLEQMEQTNDRLSNELTTASQKCGLLSQQHDQLQSTNQELAAKADSLLKTKLDLEQLNHSLTSQLSTQAQAQDQSEDAAAENARLQLELNTIKIEMEETKRMYGQEHTKSAALEQTKGALETENSKLQEQINHHMLQVGKLEAQQQEKEAALENADLCLQNEKRAHDKLKQREQELVAQNETQNTKLAQVSSRIEQLEAANQDLTQQAQVFQQQQLVQMQSKEDESLKLRLQAEKDRLETKCTDLEKQINAATIETKEAKTQLAEMKDQVKQMEEVEEDLQLQIQILTEERDTARQKEEQLFFQVTELNEEIERTRDGYVWVTDRMNEKEDELADVQEELEKYQSLLETLKEGSIHHPSQENEHQKLRLELTTKFITQLYSQAFKKDIAVDACDNSALQSFCDEIISWSNSTKHEDLEEQVTQEKTIDTADLKEAAEDDQRSVPALKHQVSNVSSVYSDDQFTPDATPDPVSDTAASTEAAATEEPAQIPSPDEKDLQEEDEDDDAYDDDEFDDEDDEKEDEKVEQEHGVAITPVDQLNGHCVNGVSSCNLLDQTKIKPCQLDDEEDTNDLYDF